MIDYGECSLDELYQVKMDIDKVAFPDRYQALCQIIQAKESALKDRSKDVEAPSEALDDENNEVVELNQWMVRFLSVSTIGGAFLGVTTISANFANISGVFSYIIYVAFLVLYAAGLVVAVRLFEKTTVGTLKANLLFWLTQVPIFMSPVLGFQLSNGVFMNIWISSVDGVQFVALIGSVFNFSFFQLEQPWAIGVNLLAIGVVLYIHMVLQSAAKKGDNVEMKG
ncbi:hypothetical protein [uncultured Shewanella sp.]|uniref:hypothetical protein n=1 Tax=uncultured Shewanella sp. TaxID=173975 RepID=UPI0026216BA6|nr:hypothetical protein [uncultured Shewanella sp.]